MPLPPAALRIASTASPTVSDWLRVMKSFRAWAATVWPRSWVWSGVGNATHLTMDAGDTIRSHDNQARSGFMGVDMASEAWTVRRLLEWTEDFLRKKGVEAARLEAQILLAHALGCKKIDL